MVKGSTSAPCSGVIPGGKRNSPAVRRRIDSANPPPQFGVVQRNSDPHIGGVVNGIARLRADIALANPVGLYFGGLSTEGWKAPDGSDPGTYWTYTRGAGPAPVRAVYEVPAAKGFTVGDIEINGRPIAFAAQIADFITMKLSAVACRIGQSTAAPMACVRPVGDRAMDVDHGAFHDVGGRSLDRHVDGDGRAGIHRNAGSLSRRKPWYLDLQFVFAEWQQIESV